MIEESDIEKAHRTGFCPQLLFFCEFARSYPCEKCFDCLDSRQIEEYYDNLEVFS